MMQIKEQTKEEKLAMHMKSTKKQLAEMLIEANIKIDELILLNSQTEILNLYPHRCPICNGSGKVDAGFYNNTNDPYWWYRNVYVKEPE
jgi:hypothetical protein